MKKKMDGNSGPVPILFGEKSEINECVTCYPQPRHLCKHKVAVIAHFKKKEKKIFGNSKPILLRLPPPLSLSLSSADVIVVVAIVAQPEMTNGRHLVATIDYYYQQQQQHQQQQQQCEQRWNENTRRSDTPWPRFSNQISRPDSLTTDYWPINSSCW